MDSGNSEGRLKREKPWMGFHPRLNPAKIRKKALEAFALDALALHFAGAAHGLGGLARAALGGLLVVATQLHLAEHAFALELLLERPERLIDVIVTNENLHRVANS